MPNILIAYHSEYGYVREIAEEIKNILSNEGFGVEFLDLKKTRARKWPQLNNYSGIIIGSCAGSFSFWTNKAIKFFDRNLIELSHSGKPVAIFKSDPFRYDKISDPIKAKQKFEKSLLRKFSFTPAQFEDFGPVFDFSRKSALKRDKRKNLRSTAKIISRKTSIVFDYKGYNDFRDWDEIRRFANTFVKRFEKNKQNSSENLVECPACGKKTSAVDAYCIICGEKLD